MTLEQSLNGNWNVDPVHSNLGFSAKFMGVTTFRGRITEVSAVLEQGDAGFALSGTADPTSISIAGPPPFRDAVMGDEFFAVASHPELTFSSSSVEVSDDGQIVVEGDLTLRGVSNPVRATGRWTEPVDDAFGQRRAHLSLTATIDRSAYGFSWDAPLPAGGSALSRDVELELELALVAAAQEAG